MAATERPHTLFVSWQAILKRLEMCAGGVQLTPTPITRGSLSAHRTHTAKSSPAQVRVPACI